MQWDDSTNAGFSPAKPWLPLMDNYKEVNVKRQERDDDSILKYYRELIQMRQGEDALQIGDHLPVYTEGNLLAYIRAGDKRKILIVLNLGKEEENFEPDMDGKILRGEIFMTTAGPGEDRKFEKKITLKPNEGLIIFLKD
jgi:alpha-glucosidase